MRRLVRNNCNAKSVCFALSGLLLLFLVGSCSMITICYDTPYSVKKAAKQENATPLTVDGLKEMLVADTTHYKIVVMYDLCCEPCMYMCQNYYPKMIAQTDTSEVRWLFVKTSSGGLSYTEQRLNSFGIFQQVYYLRDDTPIFASKPSNTEGLVNISRYLAGNNAIDDGYGIPLTYLVDKRGHIKLKSEARDEAYSLEPMQLTDLRTPLREVDFTQIDTLAATPPSATCTPAGCN